MKPTTSEEDFEIGEVLTLMGITQKGKNRIVENGAQWIVLKVSKGNPFMRSGSPLIRSLKTNNLRWITGNKDFVIVKRLKE